MSNVLFYLFKSTPPITKIYMLCIGIICILTHLGYAYGSTFLLTKYHLAEILHGNFSHLYRCFCFIFFFGKTGIESFLHIMFFYRYSCMLEESYMYLSEYIYVLFWIHISLFVASNFVITCMGPALSCIVTFLWTRRNPRALVQAYGFVTFRAFYVPFILPLFTLISNRTINIEELLGIVCGQIIYFMKECYPKFGRDFLKTPCWLHKLCREEHECCKVIKTDETDLNKMKEMITNNLKQAKEEQLKNKDDYDSDDYTDRTLSPATEKLVDTQVKEILKQNEAKNEEDGEKENTPKNEESNEKMSVDTKNSSKDEEISNSNEINVGSPNLPNKTEIDKLADDFVEAVADESSESFKELSSEPVKRETKLVENISSQISKAIDKDNIKMAIESVTSLAKGLFNEDVSEDGHKVGDKDEDEEVKHYHIQEDSIFNDDWEEADIADVTEDDESEREFVTSNNSFITDNTENEEDESEEWGSK